MFDNPKKELERLEQQLLAARKPAPEIEEFDDLQDDFYIDEDDDGIYDEELSAMLSGKSYVNFDERRAAREFSRRSAGFDPEPEDYELERERYVPAPKKKSPVGMVLVTLLELAVAIGLILWWAQHLGWLK